MLSKTRPDCLILGLGVPRLDPANTRLLRHGARLDISPDTGLVVAEQVRVFFVEHAVDFQDVAVAGGALEFVARAVEAEDEGLFGWEDWVAAGFFFFSCFFFVLSASEVGLCAVVAMRAAAAVAFFPLRSAGAVWSAVAIVVASIVAVGVVWHSRSVYSWARLRTSSRLRGFMAID
jgi:hypothetical protein